MRLQTLDLPVVEVIHIDAGVVVEGPLVFTVKIVSYLCDCLVNYCIDWWGKDAVVHLDNVDVFLSVEHTVVHAGLL